MRILHAVRSDGFAGVERHVARLARGQAEAGEAVVVVGGEPAAMARELDGVPHLPAASLPDVAQALRRHGRRADVVHVHMTAAEVAAGLALWSAHPAVVTTRHFARPRGSGAAGPLVAAAARRPLRAQIAISHYVARHVDGPTTVVHPGVDVAPHDPAAREKVVLVLQRLEPEKATDVALRAFAASGVAAEGWRLRVAGAGSREPALRRLAERLRLDVEFLGHHRDAPALLRTAGVLLAPCPVEGLGLSVLEAMAHGLPVVAADAGGHTELLGGLDPRALFPAGDSDAAADHLRRLVDDDVGRVAYGEAAARRQRAGFTLATQVAETGAVYRGVLS
ncbi:glycosyltransferase family 4 protein [Puerhibacterium puerhi]|uniref:glycosyltransferase family 4 protein n=1 Tax=Puerhibacterium puerhi TaxID=2692623 RepID=UPI0013597B33|nr:glycosyltransferase family 4 protein [Puerhibacterium puerhi]